MSTARDIIQDALKGLAVLGVGSSLSAEEASDALTVLNDMMASFSAEGGQTYQEIKETFPLTGQQSYTIAVGGDFDTQAPLDIKAAYVTQSTYDYQLVKYDEKQYAQITDKQTQGIYEGAYYYDGNYPTARIYLAPVPISGTITIYSRKYLTSFDSLNSNYDFPAHYRAMLVANLRCWLAPYYEKEPSPQNKRIAKQTKNAVISQNKRNNVAVSFVSGVPNRNRNYGNIYTGFDNANN